MKIGAVFSQADSGTDAAAIGRWAIEAERAGFDHILAYDHVLGAAPERLGPGPFGAFPAAPYTTAHTYHEILVLFSHLAAITTSIELVPSVLVLPQRQTALAAKQLATLDLLSAGRVRVAVGVGWNFAEYEGLGVAFADRFALLEEQLEVMRLLWSQPVVDFAGRFHRLDEVGINPLPARRLPIMIGTGASHAALRRVVRLADGWMPLLLPGLDPIALTEGVRRLRHLAENSGRDPMSIPVHARVHLVEDWRRHFEEALELGCSHCSIGFPRLQKPGRPHEEHLAAIIEAKQFVDTWT